MRESARKKLSGAHHLSDGTPKPCGLQDAVYPLMWPPASIRQLPVLPPPMVTHHRQRSVTSPCLPLDVPWPLLSFYRGDGTQHNQKDSGQGSLKGVVKGVAQIHGSSFRTETQLSGSGRRSSKRNKRNGRRQLTGTNRRCGCSDAGLRFPWARWETLEYLKPSMVFQPLPS